MLARTEPGSQRHHGLSYLLVPMDQAGVEVRPIEQLTGTSEFNEVFFAGARTAADLVVGEPGDGWQVAMGTLGFERGVSTLGQQVGFAARARRAHRRWRSANGAIDDPVIRDRLAQAQGRARGDAAQRAAHAAAVDGDDRRRGRPVDRQAASGPSWHRDARRARDGRPRRRRAR